MSYFTLFYLENPFKSNLTLPFSFIFQRATSPKVCELEKGVLSPDAFSNMCWKTITFHSAVVIYEMNVPFSTVWTPKRTPWWGCHDLLCSVPGGDPAFTGVHTKHSGETCITTFQHWDWPSILSATKGCQALFKVTGAQVGVMKSRSCWQWSHGECLENGLWPWKFTPPPKETVTTQISIVTASSGNLIWNIPCLTEENNCKHDGASIIMSMSYNRTTGTQPICSLVDHVSVRCVCCGVLEMKEPHHT